MDLEVEILVEAVACISQGDGLFHGFAMAKRLREHEASQGLTGHGTLYKALGRLEDGGLLESWWEDPEVAQAEGRPRRRLYRITTAGQAAVAAALGDRAARADEARARVQHPRVQPA